jgi:hypothetical protein
MAGATPLPAREWAGKQEAEKKKPRLSAVFPGVGGAFIVLGEAASESEEPEIGG